MRKSMLLLLMSPGLQKCNLIELLKNVKFSPKIFTLGDFETTLNYITYLTNFSYVLNILKIFHIVMQYIRRSFSVYKLLQFVFKIETIVLESPIYDTPKITFCLHYFNIHY